MLSRDPRPAASVLSVCAALLLTRALLRLRQAEARQDQLLRHASELGAKPLVR